MSHYRTILSLDGGGIRGVIAAKLLVEIEKLTGKQIHQLFDLIVGTSTGGILSVGLTKGDNPLTAADMLKLYADRGDEIFSRSLWKRATSVQGFTDERYDQGPLESILTELLGDSELKNTHPDIVVTSYDIERRKPYYFKTSKAGDANGDRNHLLRHVARATSAAPTYFEPLLLDDSQWSGEQGSRALIDGGVFANNPSMIALSEALFSGTKMNGILLCSIGTGTNNRKISYSDAKDWGMLGWIEPVLSVMMDGMSDSANYLAQRLLPPVRRQQRYFRFDKELKGANDDMDDTTERNINGLIALADNVIVEKHSELKRLAGQLNKRYSAKNSGGTTS